MENNKIGNFICELRKSNNMTQKDLGNKLGVTDKAVSKWERGMGYPDISILTSISNILGVTTNELLSGEKSKDEIMISEEEENKISNTLNYAEKIVKQKKYKFSNILILCITASFLLATFICCLCDYIINKNMSWSIIVLGSLFFSWCVIISFIYSEKNKFIRSLTCLSILLLPLLFLIEGFTTQKHWFFPIGMPVSIISLIYIWGFSCLFYLTKINRWYISSMVIGLAPILTIAINYIVNSALRNPGGDNGEALSSICSIIVAIIIFIIGFVRRK